MAANGRRYGFSGAITGAASKTAVLFAGTAAVRPALYDIIVSSNATPADNSSEWKVLRFGTAVGTSTAAVPVAFDSGDPAASTVCGTIATVEPTTYGTVAVLDFAHNQRATFRWVAAPGSEIVCPASATQGIGQQCTGVGGSGVVEIVSWAFME